MIELQDVTKRYGDTAVLDGLSLSIGRGELVYLTGPSGAGKSTLLRLLFAAERATTGTVKVAGRDLSRLRTSGIPYLRRNVGVVFQDFKLLRNRTAAENVALALEVLGTRRLEIARRVSAVLEEVGLTHRASAFPEKLSGGEQQRLAIARAVVAEPAVVLADEPTGNLDATTGADILRLLIRANQRGATVVIATHDVALMQSAPSRTIALVAGRVASDTPAPAPASTPTSTPTPAPTAPAPPPPPENLPAP